MRATFRALGRGKLQVTPTNFTAQVERYMTKFVTSVRDEVAPYPPVPPPPNRYIRTGKLGRGWTITPVSATSSGLSVRLINNVQYAKYVQGLFQRWYHARTGWKVLQDYEHRDTYVSGLRALYSQFRVSGS